MLTARIDPGLITDLDRFADGKVTEDGKEMTRTDAAALAVSRLISEGKAGAYYPSERERKLLDGLRLLRRRKPEAAEFYMLAGEVAISSDRGADVVEKFASVVQGFAQLAPESPPLAQEPTSEKQAAAHGKGRR